MIRARRYTPLLLAALLLPGCQGPGGQTTGLSGPAGVKGAPAPGELDVDPNDPCVTNLGALVENLILYYSVRHRMPDSLTELRPTSVSGQKISLTCPQTGRPYTYVPQGIHPPYDLMPTASVLILYDDQPAHPIVKHIAVGNDEYDLKQTVRYGIVYKPTAPGQPVSMHVAPIEDNLLKIYLSTPQPGAAGAPPVPTGR
jgi:hypothetical protein